MVTFVVLGCGQSQRSEQTMITHAIRATLADFIGRHVSAFCNDFTPAVESHISSGHDCPQGAARAFAVLRNAAELYSKSELPSGLTISDVHWHKDNASAVTTWPWPDIKRRIGLEFEKRSGRWLIATRTRLVDRRLCSKLSHETVCNHSISVEFTAP